MTDTPARLAPLIALNEATVEFYANVEALANSNLSRADVARDLSTELHAQRAARAALEEKIHELTRPMGDAEYYTRAPGGWMDETKELEARLNQAEAARATAYAEGQRAGIEAAMLAVAALPVRLNGRVNRGEVFDALVVLRDTPAPRREEPHDG